MTEAEKRLEQFRVRRDDLKADLELLELLNRSDKTVEPGAVTDHREATRRAKNAISRSLVYYSQASMLLEQ
ncbi:hypothetical protein [Corallococcus coralloides]|uniref:hypothetical protein n=1 Tax=Corallococcus coralloides TaxID=184914 RepID=UPI0011D2270B|nr:hypothetical protein [Corallococcus coralloides]